MRKYLAIALVLFTNPVIAKPIPSVREDALRLAQAQLDQNAYRSLFTSIMERQIATCPDLPSAAAQMGRNYVENLGNHMPDVQKAVADGYIKYIPAQFLAPIANFFESPAGRHMIANGMQAMIGPMTSQIQLCGDRTGAGSVGSMDAVRQSLSSADMASIRAFAHAPTGQAFIAANQQITPIMVAAFGKAAQKARQEAGYPR